MSIRPAYAGGAAMRHNLSGFFSAQVTILRAASTQNSYGEMVPSWSPLAEHCELDALVAGGDVSIRMKRQEVRTSSVGYEMEYRRVLLNGSYPRIDHADRLRYGDRDWAIVSIVIDVTGSFTELLVESIEPGNL